MFSWQAKTDKEKKFIADQKRTIPKIKNPDALKARDVANFTRNTLNKTSDVVGSALKPFGRVVATGIGKDITTKGLGTMKQVGKTGSVIGDLKDIGGTALEIASYFTGAGEAKGALTGAKTLGRVALGEGAAGAMQGAGSALQENKSLGGVLKDTAVGFGVGATAGVALHGAGKLFSWGKKAAPVVEDTATKSVTEDIAQKANNPAQLLLPPGKTKTDFYVGADGNVAKDVRGAARLGTQPRREVINGEVFTNDKTSYEPYTPPDQLPVITAGEGKRVPKNEFSATQPVTETRPNPNTVTLPKKGVENKGSFDSSFSKMAPETSTTKTSTTTTPRRKPTLTKQDFTESFKEDPSFKNTSWEEQSTKYSELDEETAKRVARGEQAAPNGANATYVWTEEVNKAIERGDTDEIVRLADSPAGTSQAGQNLQFGKNAKMRDNPVEAIRQIQEIRRAKVAPRAVEETTSQLRQIMKDARDSVLRQVECR